MPAGSFFCLHHSNATFMRPYPILWILLLGSVHLRGQTCNALFTFGSTNLTIQFTDQSTHAPGDPIISWSWDFDDGGTSSQQHPSHTFPEADKYDVNLTITTQNGCTSNLQIRIDICDFGVNYTVGACNAQGQVPVALHITDLFNNANDIDVILDGQSVPGSPFPINAQNPVDINVLVPGDGLNHTILIQSLDIETCSKTVTLTTEDCSSDCFLSSLSVGYAPGTIHNVQVDDNFFSPQSIAIVLGDIVHFTWAGGGHSTTSDATSGADSWNSGVLGAGSTFDVEIHDPGTHRYYCIPHGGPNGVGMSGQILSNCPTGTTTAIVIQFTTTIANAAGYQVLWDNVPVPGSPFDYNGTGPQSVAISIAGDGMPHTLIVRDVAVPACDLDLIYDAPDCGQGGGNPVCSISGSVGAFGSCINMNVTTNLTVNVSNGGSGFLVSIDGGPNTSYPYTGATTTIPVTLAGDGNNHTVEITDNADPGCSALINVITPDCTLPCSISNLSATVASGTGGSSGIVHTVNVEDFQFNPDVINITVGDVVKWIWTGAIAHTSTSDATGGQDSWNSGLLNTGATYTSPVLTEGMHPYYCVPHGAPGGVGMSGTIQVLPACNEFGQTPVQVNFNVTNGGAPGYHMIVDGNTAGTFSYVPGNAQSVSVLIAGDGLSHTILVEDIANNACNANVGVVTPDCSGGGNPCMVSFNPAITGACINNMVAVNLNVTGTNTSTMYSVLLDGQPVDTFAYSNPNAQINVPGNGQVHTIVVMDTGDPACMATANLTTPDCTLPCTINISTLSFGNAMAHTVSVQDFQFSPSEITINLGDTLHFNWTGVIPHTVTSDAPSGPGAFNSGLLSQGATWTLIPNATGDFPYYCIPHGAPGGVGMSGMIHVTSSCDSMMANGTMQIIYAGTSGQGFVVTEDGAPIAGSPFPFSPTGQQTISLNVDGDGAIHSFVVADAGNPGCLAQNIIAVPDCGQACTLNITQANVSACTGNTVTLSVGFSSNQPNGSYNIYKDALKLNPAPLSTDSTGNGVYTAMIVGNNTNSTIKVQFIENSNCADSVFVQLPACGGPCLVSNFKIGQRGVTHFVEVKDFEFSPSQLDVLLGDTVQFVWTGIIPHTTTSDAFMGPNTWNSGLLGQGSSYNLVLGETGAFPYYCQPHGGPGGIGMSGVIQVLDTCDLNSWRTNLSFDVSAGSPLGYNVFVDGVRITDPPLQYDDPVGHNEQILDLPGDGSWHLVTMQDVETGFCAYTQPIQTSICGAGCSVVNLSANAGTNIVHIVEVRDFDYFPSQITVSAGEKIRFIWTGQIPHTVTSDAISGNDVWNSGLLGEGASFEIMIQTPGIHPYFCIPHGGPAGIGMSGVITVLPPCTDNTEHVQARFEVTNGSLQGYTLFVDGVPFGENPRAYDNRMGANEVIIAHPADNMIHILTVQDMNNAICAASDFFTTTTCSAACQLNGLDYFLGNGRRHIVAVKDFEFEPRQLETELGDTIHFTWSGVIPHTVTSDASTGNSVFNSGLLGQGASYDLVLTEPGAHPYYCIPHGAPGGIGMAGTIHVVDPCDDGNVYVDFRFFASGPGLSYDVFNHDTILLNDQPYRPGGIQNFTLNLPAQGQSHLIEVTDNGPDDCKTSIALDSFDCSDPCFLVRAAYAYDINFSTLSVQFTDRSKGHIIGWNWDFGDGQTSQEQNPVHLFSEATLYTVCLTITDMNGCTEQVCDKLRLGADVCQASFTYIQDGLDITFYNTSDVSATDISATWSFGDGGTSLLYDSTSHQYALGLYEVCLTVASSGCVNTICRTLDLTDSCLALKAAYSTMAESGNPLQYHFTDQSTGPVGSRLWGFGDGQISTAIHPDHTYAQEGIYTVCLLILDGEGNCTSSDCRSLYVGTTGLDPVEIPMQQIRVMPNPVSSAHGRIQLGGFQEKDRGTEGVLSLLDIQGQVVLRQPVQIEETAEISVPILPGPYYIHVVSGRSTYGAMVVVQ